MLAGAGLKLGRGSYHGWEWITRIARMAEGISQGRVSPDIRARISRVPIRVIQKHPRHPWLKNRLPPRRAVVRANTPSPIRGIRVIRPIRGKNNPEPGARSVVRVGHCHQPSSTIRG
jgi:hypothetical protein